MIRLTEVRHLYPEKRFIINRPSGLDVYTFIHFISSITVVIDGISVRTEPNTCIIYSPSTPQLYFTKTPIIHDWLHFTLDAGYFESIGLKTDMLLTPSHSEFITPIVKELELEFASEKPHGERLISSKAEELFIKLSRAVGGEVPFAVSFDTEQRFKELRSELFSSLSHNWTVAEMASKVGLSASRFYSSYRSIFGSSPVNDLISARIDASKKSLAFTSDPIANIARDLGYSNITHFMRQFRSFVGMTPGQYRKNSRQ